MLAAAFELVLEVACAATGHGLLWAATFGRWKPFQGGDDWATLAGAVFWGMVLVGSVVWFVR